METVLRPSLPSLTLHYSFLGHELPHDLPQTTNFALVPFQSRRLHARHAAPRQDRAESVICTHAIG